MSICLGQDKGINYYQSQEYDEAQKYYESVLLENGRNPQAQFGRGSSAFQQGDLETAKHAFEQSLKSKDTQLQSKAMYNLGNTFYKNEKKEEALAFYRKALELNPKDKDAKYNYEFLKYQSPPPEDQKKQEQDQSDDDEENQEQDQKDQEKEKQEQENKDQKQEDKEEKEEQQENKEQNQNQNQAQPEPKEQQASEEEKSQDLKQAESILDALKQDEKIMQKQQIARSKSRKLAKDW
ncbi:MAG: tetratricopeptide repeat protein [Candidatus Marinimicrobia bacterium]|nr:tetratricopeptide repeat protein [Candidatus Neomarinimicrobiota bacterium]MBL7029794.1 tetratricopeptide repeat protein [Candidatus Neomarinimicrobiota bacterium]